MEKIMTKIRERIYNTACKIYLREAICNIGKIVEYDDKIVCYVEQKSIDKYVSNNSSYRFRLNGINQTNDIIKETVENFKLNKPVYYIFENIEFNKSLQIISLGGNIIFRNCVFNNNVGILFGKEIIFENNKYTDSYSVNHYKNCFFSVTGVDKIIFINDNYICRHALEQCEEKVFGMEIAAKEIEFINTGLNAEYPININAIKTAITNSTIDSNEVYIDSKSIEFNNSLILAKNGVLIENTNCDFVGNIQAPIVFYNGIDLAEENREICKIDEEKKNLIISRLLLIEKLRNLSSYCQQLNEHKLQNVKSNFNKQSIGKILKKDNFKV